MLDREAALSWYRRNRERSRALFDLISADAYYSRPIGLRHPLVFYDGHLPGFSFNTLVKKALGGPSIDPRLEALFARGIDPHESRSPQSTQGTQRTAAEWTWGNDVSARCAATPAESGLRVLCVPA